MSGIPGGAGGAEGGKPDSGASGGCPDGSAMSGSPTEGGKPDGGDNGGSPGSTGSPGSCVKPASRGSPEAIPSAPPTPKPSPPSTAPRTGVTGASNARRYAASRALGACALARSAAGAMPGRDPAPGAIPAA